MLKAAEKKRPGGVGELGDPKMVCVLSRLCKQLAACVCSLA